MNGAGESNVKQCCAAFYGSDVARLLLGESFHPGGTAHRSPGSINSTYSRFQGVDVAAGRGTSAFHLAESIGCQVVGVDLSEENVKLATDEAIGRGVDTA